MPNPDKQTQRLKATLDGMVAHIAEQHTLVLDYSTQVDIINAGLTEIYIEHRQSRVRIAASLAGDTFAAMLGARDREIWVVEYPEHRDGVFQQTRKMSLTEALRVFDWSCRLVVAIQQTIREAV